MESNPIYTFRTQQHNNPNQQKPYDFNSKETKNSTLENDVYLNLSQSSERGRKNDSDDDNSVQLNKQQTYNMIGMNKKQALLNFKINELQKICMTLTQANKKLLDRVDELENLREISQKSQSPRDSLRQSYATSILEQTQLFNGFLEIENLVKDYRNSLQHCRFKIQQRIFEHQRVNEILKEEISRLNAKDLVIEKKIIELEKSNMILETRNEYLEAQFKTKDKKVKSFKKLPTIAKTCQMSYKGKQLSQSGFSTTVHTQLEELIQKLINQLEYERKTKEKLKDEIKRLGKQLINVEKQIMVKNSKIYLLQLNAIKRERMSLANTHRQYDQSIDVDSLVTYKRQLADTPQKNIKSFTFIDMLNHEVTVSFIEKLHIAWEIVQFFDRKISQKDYRTVLVEDFIINNLTSKNYNMISIGCQLKNQQRNVQQQTRQSAILNMAFILDNLINQVPDEQSQQLQKQYCQYKQQLSKMLQYILSKRKELLGQPIQNLKKQIKQIIFAINTP